MKILLDTDICIYTIQETNPKISIDNDFSWLIVEHKFHFSRLQPLE